MLRRTIYSLVLVALTVLSGAMPAGCTFIADITNNESGSFTVYHDKQPLHLKSPSGESARLTNNKAASDPTWQELMAFLRADNTDQKPYIADSYACVAFAEELHNNAEVAGIKAAFVGVQFEDGTVGHALNAFNTTDRGLVFIDCTSPVRSDSVYHPMLELGTSEDGDGGEAQVTGADKIAYVEIGREYGLIGIEVATSSEYSFYEAYLAESEQFGLDAEAFNRDLDAYNQMVDAFNQEVGAYNQAVAAYEQEVEEYNEALRGRTKIAEPEYSRFKEWASELDDSLAMLMDIKAGLESKQSELKSILDGLQKRQLELDAASSAIGNVSWQPLGTVESIEVYW